MSIEALSWGINQDTDTPTSKLVLLVLCNYANMDNKCFPSEKHLSKLCGVSERSIRRCIKQLKEKNLIQVSLRNFNSNEYTLLLQDTHDLSYRTPVTNNTKVDTKDIYTPQFEYFWKLYPRKVSKKKAWSIFKKIPERDWTNIIEAVRHLIKQNIETKFIPHPSTWLNQERYNDPIEEKKNNSLNNLAG